MTAVSIWPGAVKTELVLDKFKDPGVTWKIGEFQATVRSNFIIFRARPLFYYSINPHSTKFCKPSTDLLHIFMPMVMRGLIGKSRKSIKMSKAKW